MSRRANSLGLLPPFNLCAGGTWNGAGGAGPTWLKDGMGDQVVGGIALGAFLWGMTGFFGGLYKMGYGVGKLD